MAEEKYQKVLELKPNDKTAFDSLIYALKKQKKYEQAEQLCKKTSGPFQKML